jgi:hypothetical protein
MMNLQLQEVKCFIQVHWARSYDLRQDFGLGALSTAVAA